MENGIDFLATLFTSGLGYSAINTARSALSSVLILLNNITFGTHPLVARFLKGVFQLKPSLPRYSSIWDVSVVLQHLRSLGPPTQLELKSLTKKTTMLLCLLTGQRCQTLTKLDTALMQENRVYYWRQTQNHQAREALRAHRTTGIPNRRVDLRSVPLEAVHSAYKTNSRDARYQAAYQLCQAAQASLQLHCREMGQKCSKGLGN